MVELPSARLFHEYNCSRRKLLFSKRSFIETVLKQVSTGQKHAVCCADYRHWRKYGSEVNFTYVFEWNKIWKTSLKIFCRLAALCASHKDILVTDRKAKMLNSCAMVMYLYSTTYPLLPSSCYTTKKDCVLSSLEDYYMLLVDLYCMCYLKSNRSVMLS